MIKCPNCGSAAQTRVDDEVNYDHSFDQMKCNDCGFEWVKEFSFDGKLAGYQFKKDGVYYFYSPRGELIKTL